MSLFSSKRHNSKQQLSYIISLLLVLFLVIVSLSYSLYFNQFTQDLRNEASGKVVNVKPSENISSIINSSENDDLIVLSAGEYDISETITISGKNLRIVGAGGDFTSFIGNADPLFEITSGNIIFEDVGFRDSFNNSIEVVGSSTSLTIKESKFEDISGIALTSSGILDIERSSFLSCGGAIEITDGSSSISNVDISKTTNRPAIQVSGGELVLNNSLIYNNEDIGVNILEGSTFTGTQLTLVNNLTGIYSSTENFTLKNSIIEGSSEVGLDLDVDEGSLEANQISYVNSFSNDGGDFFPESISSFTGVLNLDSGFVSSTDYNLSSTSSLKDQGDPSIFDKDGSRSDYGAFGGSPSFLGILNSKPVITSQPPGEILRPNQRYEYSIIATDPDNDQITYTVINTDTPRFISQNGNKFIGSPSITDIGFFALMVVVSDGQGNNIVHPISINVIPEGSIPIVNPTNAPTPTSAVPTPTQIIPTVTVSPEPVIDDTIIEFISPVSGTVLNSDDNIIAWEILEGVELSEIKLSYSNDSQNYTEIVTLGGEERSFVWNEISDIPEGRYTIEISITSSDGTNVKKRSEQFEIKAATTEESIIINSVSPNEDSIISDTTPQIVVSFTPEVRELDREKTKFLVNGEAVDYIPQNKSLTHDVITPIEGSINVEVTIVSKDGRTGTRAWTFRVTVESTPVPSEAPNVNQTLLGLPQNLGLLILCVLIVGLFGLIMFLTLRLLKTIREEREGNLDSEFDDFYAESENTSKEIKKDDKKELSHETEINLNYDKKNESEKEAQDLDIPAEYLKKNDNSATNVKNNEFIQVDNEVNNSIKDPDEITSLVNSDTSEGVVVKTEIPDPFLNSSNRTATTGIRQVNSGDSASSLKNDQINPTSSDSVSSDDQLNTDNTSGSSPNNQVNSTKVPPDSEEDKLPDSSLPTDIPIEDMSEDEKYVQQLKEKYNITDDDIKNYQKNNNQEK